ncbi:MAG: hypothetical protein LAT54_03565 [Cryomorphaceae bacterium]|nr:hypothetical protein [Cryomorphaceae bacterium]
MLRLLFFLLALNTYAHPFYVSVMEVHYNKEAQTLECALKIFTDDLENAIGDFEGKPILNLGTNNEPVDADARVWNYIQQHIKLDGHQLQYVGREGDLDAQWIYFEVPLKNIKEAQWTWTGLIHVLPSQKNILQIHLGDKQQTFIFDRRKQTQRIGILP